MLETFKAFIQTLPPEYLLGTFFATIAMFVAFLHFIKKELNEESRYIAVNVLDTKDSITDYAKDLQKEVKPDTFFYKEYLGSTLDFVEKHLGELKLFSYKTWEKHFSYSLIYTVFFFYLIWLFGGSGSIGTLHLFFKETQLIVSLYLIYSISIIYFAFLKIEKTTNFLTKYIPSFSYLSNIWQERLITVVGGVLISGGVAGGIGVVVSRILKIGVLGVLAGIAATIEISGAAYELIGEIEPINKLKILYILFFLILPFINSIFDYLSMYFSRLFAYKILHTHKKWKVFVDVVVDTLIAIALLVALATTLFYVLEYANGFIDDEKLKIPVEFYKTAFLVNPFSKDVLWITLMFASTLIPTVAHLVMGLYSLLAIYVVKPHLEKLANDLINLNENSYEKHRIANELALHKQSFMLKVHMFIGIAILIGFLLSAIALLLKIGFNII